MKSVFVKISIPLIIMMLIVGFTVNDKYRHDETGYNEMASGEISAKVVIRGYYNKPASIQDEETIILDGLSKGEYVEIGIQGVIVDFEHVALTWEDNNLVEEGIINSFDKLADQTILIKTYMPEGIPIEKIKWKSASGRYYEWIISENSLDGESGNVWEFDLE